MVALKERAPIDLAGRKILDLRDLFNEAIARDVGAWPTKYICVLDGHVNPDS